MTTKKARIPVKDAGLDAQHLVVHGYKNCLRRNYLLQIVVDDVEKIYASAKLADKLAFDKNRLKNWLEDGVVPRAIFYDLIKLWESKKCLSSHHEFATKDSDSNKKSSRHFVDIGITFAGFEKLGAHHQLLDLFRKKAPAYSQGAVMRAAEKLGDSGSSSPSHWCGRYQKDKVHVILVVHAEIHSSGSSGFLDFENTISDLLIPGQAGISALQTDWIEESVFLDDQREVHFGYIDGLSSPHFLVIPKTKPVNPVKPVKAESDFNQHEAGELLLGYPRNDGSNAWQVPGAYYQEHGPTPLQPQPAEVAYGRFFSDGSFGIFRKVYQNTPVFERYLNAQAIRVQGARSLAYTVGWLKAKLLGRWPNGERVEENIETTDPRQLLPAQQSRITAKYVESVTQTDQDQLGFKPVKSDPNTTGSTTHPAAPNPSLDGDLNGFRCPFGAHIRRMNPRDDPVVPKMKRPLLRRGLPYGPKYPIQEDGLFEDDMKDRGLLGLFFCASIEDQFEHVLANWANNNPMGMPFKQHGKDPLIGNQALLVGQFEIPMRNAESIWLNDLPVFVETRGTCYAFFPSIKALNRIAEGRIATSTKFLESD